MGCPFPQRKVPSRWQTVKDLFFRFFSTNRAVFSAENLHAILDTTVDAIVTADEQGIMLSFNNAAEDMFGYTRQEAIGKNVSLLMPEPFCSQHDAYIQNYLTTGVAKIIGIGREVVAKRKDGTVFPADIAISEVLVQGVRLFTGIIRDITEEKKAEESLLKNACIEAELKAKNQYISILSHELRTPLTSLHASIGLLLAEEDLPQRTKELLSIAYRTSQRLNKITSDLLDIGRIQSGKLKVECAPLSIAAVLREAVAASRLLATKMDVSFSEDIADGCVFADYNRLIQVVINLLSNAVKFSPIHGTITVSAECLKDWVRVSVHDQGRGIPKEAQGKLFTPFFQVPGSHPRSVDGAGLGLHICKCIIEQLGGTIGFRSSEGEGTTFFFELPMHHKGESCPIP